MIIDIRIPILDPRAFFVLSSFFYSVKRPEDLDRIKELFKEKIPKFNFGSLSNITAHETKDIIESLRFKSKETIRLFKDQRKEADNFLSDVILELEEET